MNTLFVNNKEIDLLANKQDNVKNIINIYTKLKPFYKRIIKYRLKLDILLISGLEEGNTNDYREMLCMLNYIDQGGKEHINNNFGSYIFSSLFIHKSNDVLYQFIKYNIVEDQDINTIINLIDFEKIKKMYYSTPYGSKELEGINKILLIR